MSASATAILDRTSLSTWLCLTPVVRTCRPVRLVCNVLLWVRSISVPDLSDWLYCVTVAVSTYNVSDTITNTTVDVNVVGAAVREHVGWERASTSKTS